MSAIAKKTPSTKKARKSKARAKSTIRVRQVRSGIGFDKTQRSTLRALGLSRIGRVREHPDNPQVRGMIAKVTHLVVVESERGDSE